jgi:hypothetical protein
MEFGPQWRRAWPGFEGAGAGNNRISWADGPIGEGSTDFPDPLGGNYIGRSTGSNVNGSFTINCDIKGQAAAWLWVTHLGNRKTQPMEYELKVDGKVVLHRKATEKQWLGDMGITSGLGAPWTPKWFDKTYADRYAEIVQVNFAPGKSRFEVNNCQLAALTAAPAAKAADMAKYIDTIRQEISRYRRQFMFAYCADARCDLKPTDSQAASGMILLRVPEDQAFVPDWAPSPGDRVGTIKACCANGGLVVVPLSVCSLKKTGALSASVGILKDAQGVALANSASSVEAWFCQKVPRLQDGKLEFWPWILTRRCGPLEEREPAAMVLVIGPSPAARAGVYSGMVKLSFTGGQLEAPLELEVINAGPLPAEQPTFGALHHSGDAREFWGALTEGAAENQLDAATAKLRKELLAAGDLDAFCINGATIAGKVPSVDDESLVRALKGYPTKQTLGKTLISLNQPLWRLRDSDRNSDQYKRIMGGIVNRTAAAAQRAGLPDYLLMAGERTKPDELKDLSARCEALSAAGGSVAAATFASTLNDVPDAKRANLLAPFTALILNPDAEKTPAIIESFKSGAKDRCVYIWAMSPSRYIAGFYAASVGAAGCYLQDLYSDDEPFDGFSFLGNALLAAVPDASPNPGPGLAISPTLAALRLRQGREDYLLMQRAAKLRRKLEDAKLHCQQLDNVLGDIRSKAVAGGAAWYDGRMLRSSNFPPSQLEKWREDLTRACGLAQGMFGGK